MLAHIMRLPVIGASVDNGSVDVVSGGVDLDQIAIEATAAATSDREIPQKMLEEVSLSLSTMYVAGVMAELMLHGIEVDGRLGLWGWSDYRYARTLLRDAFNTETPLYYCQRLASAVLDENWQWVSAVAGEIEAKGQVSVDDIARLRTVMEMA